MKNIKKVQFDEYRDKIVVYVSNGDREFILGNILSSIDGIFIIQSEHFDFDYKLTFEGYKDLEQAKETCQVLFEQWLNNFYAQV